MKNFTTKSVLLLLTLMTTLITQAQIVSSTADDGSEGTLRKEIADTPPGGVITFLPGLGEITLLSEIVIDKDLNILGTVIIDAGMNGRVFSITSGADVYMNEAELKNGLAADGGAVYVDAASFMCEECSFHDNVANGASGSGGAIFINTGGQVTLDSSTLYANQANRAGGAIEDNSGEGLGLTLIDTDMMSNNAGVSPATAAPGNGGGLHITGPGDVNIQGGTVSDNIAAKEGGGLWNGSGLMDITGVTITSNDAVGDATGGGGIFNNGGTVQVDATTTLSGNTATGATPGGRGGAIFNHTDGVLLLATGLSIEGNYASRAGGAIEDNSGGTLNLDGIDFAQNSAGVDIGLVETVSPNPGNGGAIHLSGTTNASISNSNFTENLSASEGGALWNNLGTMTLNSTSVMSNESYGADADNGGGGVFNNGGSLSMMDSYIIENVASGAAGSGGGVFSVAGQVTISATELNSNVANRAGGGIEIVDGNLILNNGTVLIGNNAGVAPATAAPGNGGALHITGPADCTVSDVTVRLNEAASEGGGLWNSTGMMRVQNSVIKGNKAYGDAADNGGGGIFNNGGTTEVYNVSFLNNKALGTAGSGGAILNFLGTLTVEESQVYNNSSMRAGGGIEEVSAGESLLTVTNTNFKRNSTAASPGNGGAIHITGPGDAMINGGIYENNTAAAEGGALWNGTGTMNITDASILRNTASGAEADQGGGGVFNAGGTVIIDQSVVKGNVADGAAGSGGGVLNDLGSLTISNTALKGNSSMRAGGAIEDNSAEGGLLILTDLNIQNNSTGSAPGNGGGVHITGPGDSDITDCIFKANDAAREGGGLWNGSGLMTVSNCRFLANTATGAESHDGGGGLFNNGGDVVITGTQFFNNQATGTSGSGGGILSLGGSLTASDNTRLKQNKANRAGGAIEMVGGEALLSDVQFVLNEASDAAGAANPGNGGAIHVTGESDVQIIGGYAAENVAQSEGGAFWNSAIGMMTIDGTQLENNVATGVAADNGGGALFNDGGTLYVMNASITGNLATGAAGSGGALLSVDGAVTIQDTELASNSANRAGGAIEVIAGDVEIWDSYFTNNDVDGNAGTAAPGNGGAIHITGATVMLIDRSMFYGNSAANEGGALWNQTGAEMTVNRTIIDGNNAPEGGGFFNNGGMTEIMATTFSANTAGLHGGAIDNENGTTSISRSTIAYNSTDGEGGAVYNTADIDITTSTIAYNMAGSQGGGISNLATAMIGSSILAGNSSDGEDNLAGMINSAGYNYVGGDAGFPYSATDINDTDPVVEALLADNGGPTPTLAVLSGAAVIDAGDPAIVGPDQRGLGIVGIRDIGAFEFQDQVCQTEWVSSTTPGWQATGLLIEAGVPMAINMLSSDQTITPNQGPNAGQVVNGTYVESALFIGLDEHIHSSNDGAEYTDNVNWRDWGTYFSNLSADHAQSLFGLSGTGDETAMAYRWIGFIDTDENGNYDSGSDIYLGTLDENGMVLPSDVDGRLYIGFSDRVGQFEDNLGNLVLEYCPDVDNDEVAEETSAKSSIIGATLELQVYPNPSAGPMTVESSEAYTRLQVLDMAGRVVFDEAGIARNIDRLTLSDLDEGMYVIRLYSENELLGQTLSSITR